MYRTMIISLVRELSDVLLRETADGLPGELLESLLNEPFDDLFGVLRDLETKGTLGWSFKGALG
jgi:hypothetical protein